MVVICCVGIIALQIARLGLFDGLQEGEGMSAPDIDN